MNSEEGLLGSNASIQSPKYYSKYIIITQQGKKPRDDDEPWGSSLSFTTQNKPAEDDDKHFNTSLSSVMQEKKVENDNEVHSCLSFAMVS